MDSILSSVKKLIGISPDDVNFDTDVILHINSVFSILNQLGVGPAGGYRIEDDSAVWSDYLADNQLLEMVKTYIPLKVKLFFDPPQSGTLLGSYENRINELEWRILVAAETKEGIQNER